MSSMLSSFQESGGDEDNNKPTETGAMLVTEDAAASPQSTPAPEPDAEESAQEIQAASRADQPPGGTAEAIDANSKAHLFIFDSESQEEVGSQAALSDSLAPVPANVQPIVNTISPFSLTEAQLEEDKRSITQLMSETKQVTMDPS